MFSFESVVRGHHIYKEVWTLFMGETLHCRAESGNIHDLYAIAVERDSEIVGHLPRTISTPCHIFLQRGGSITCIIIGARQFSNDLPQGGLEVPCTLNFEGALNNIEKIKKLLNEVPSQPDVKESTGLQEWK